MCVWLADPECVAWPMFSETKKRSQSQALKPLGFSLKYCLVSAAGLWPQPGPLWLRRAGCERLSLLGGKGFLFVPSLGEADECEWGSDNLCPASREQEWCCQHWCLQGEDQLPATMSTSSLSNQMLPDTHWWVHTVFCYVKKFVFN